MAEQGGRGGVHSDSVIRVLPSVSYQMGPRTEAALGMIRRYTLRKGLLESPREKTYRMNKPPACIRAE